MKTAHSSPLIEPPETVWQEAQLILYWNDALMDRYEVWEPSLIINLRPIKAFIQWHSYTVKLLDLKCVMSVMLLNRNNIFQVILSLK